MELMYLGTAAAEGIPAIFCDCKTCREAREKGGKNIRGRSQALIDNTLLIDFPPDSLYNSRRFNIDYNNIDYILVTHSHEDHFYPEDILHRCPPFGSGKKLNLYGNKKAYETLLSVIPKVGPNNINKCICFNIITPFFPFTILDYKITALKANHDKKENCLIYLIEKENKRILYAHDTAIPPEETLEYLKGIHLDLISMDCTVQLSENSSSHMGLKDNKKLINLLKEQNCCDNDTKYIINHFSHNKGKGLLHEQLKEISKPYGFSVAFDGKKVKL